MSEHVSQVKMSKVCDKIFTLFDLENVDQIEGISILVECLARATMLFSEEGKIDINTERLKSALCASIKLKQEEAKDGLRTDESN